PVRQRIAAGDKLTPRLLHPERARFKVGPAADLSDHPNKPALRLDLPMARRDAVKSAQAIGDDDKQATLDL
ncbi:MAG: hypothetical protein IBJ13_13665, partial [Sphingopyxis sp.]|nr:hypothetical protein [Sphingopyxis sp.]